jgi:hypothetical protein
MSKQRFLTKSAFKVGLECPQKLRYLAQPKVYFNNNEVAPLLQALAKGGFQVGALAKLKYPSGTEVHSATPGRKPAIQNRIIPVSND